MIRDFSVGFRYYAKTQNREKKILALNYSWYKIDTLDYLGTYWTNNKLFGFNNNSLCSNIDNFSLLL